MMTAQFGRCAISKLPFTKIYVDLLALEIDRSERRQAQRKRILHTHPPHWFSHYSTAVAVIAAGVVMGVAVENLAIPAGLRHSYAVVLARHRREIRHNDQRFLGISRVPDKRKDARVSVIAVDPLKSLPLEIHLMQRRFAPVNGIQVGNEVLHAAMFWVLQQVPFERYSVKPLRSLREFAAHEKQLLSRMRPHISEQQPQIRELLPEVARHFVDQRAL